MNAYLFRRQVTGAVRGVLVLETGQTFHTLELPWQNNRSNVSCIESGEYTAQYLPRSNSGKYRKVYHVQDVPDRTGILIHNGNTPNHTRGCVLLGMRPGVLGNQQAVLSSKTAMAKLNKILKGESLNLKIMGNYYV